MSRRGPIQLSDEHDHHWEPTGTTKTLGGVTFAVDRCTLRNCRVQRLRRVDQLPLPRPAGTA